MSDGKWSVKSDVWSYGILCYECVTAATIPYAGLSNSEMLHAVLAGHVLPPPQQCPPKLYAFLISCWVFDPAQRPDFNGILQELIKVITVNDLLKEPEFLKPPPTPEDVLMTACSMEKTTRYIYLDDNQHMDKCMPTVLDKFPAFEAERCTKVMLRRTKSIVVRNEQGYDDGKGTDDQGVGVDGAGADTGIGVIDNIQECEGGYLVPSKLPKKGEKKTKSPQKPKAKKPKKGTDKYVSSAHYDDSINEGLPAFRQRTATTGQYT